MKKLLFVLMMATAFAVVSCGEKAETITDETDAATQVAKGDESPVSTCEGNVCTADCSADCPLAKGGTCMYGKERGTEGACQAHVTGKCTGTCDKTCPHFKGAHTCTAECPADCPRAKAHVCTKECSADCPYASAAGCCPGAAKTMQAAGCGGCPLKTTCKSGS